MMPDLDCKKTRSRIARLNRYIAIAALLWVATVVAMLFVAQADHAHAAQPANGKMELAVANRAVFPLNFAMAPGGRGQ